MGQTEIDRMRDLADKRSEEKRKKGGGATAGPAEFPGPSAVGKETETVTRAIEDGEVSDSVSEEVVAPSPGSSHRPRASGRASYSTRPSPGILFSGQSSKSLEGKRLTNRSGKSSGSGSKSSGQGAFLEKIEEVSNECGSSTAGGDIAVIDQV